MLLLLIEIAKVQFAVFQALESLNGEVHGEKTKINKIQEMKITEQIWLTLNGEQELQNIVGDESMNSSSSKLPLSVENLNPLPDKKEEINLEIKADSNKIKREEKNDVNFTKDSIQNIRTNSTRSTTTSLPEKDVDDLKEKEVVDNNKNQNFLENMIAPSRHTRIALLKAAAEAAKKRTHTVNTLGNISASPSVTIPSARADVSNNSAIVIVPSIITNRMDRKPLRSLDLNVNTQIMVDQNSVENISINKSGQRDGRIQSTAISPDKQDNRLVIEKRIGAMR